MKADLKSNVLNKMYELSNGTTETISYNFQLYPSFSEILSETELKGVLVSLQDDGFVEILSGFNQIVNTLNVISLLNFSKLGLRYTKIMRSVENMTEAKTKVLKTVSVIAGGKTTFDINSHSDLYPVLKSDFSQDRLNDILVILSIDGYISASTPRFKEDSLIHSFRLTDKGINFTS